MASLIGAFAYKRKLTLTTTSGGANISGNLTDFPICVHINSDSWTTAGDRTAFFDASNSGGKRVQFFASDQTTNLAYEVDRYDSGNQIATYWVKVPTVTGNSTTEVWVAYGSDPNSSDQDQKTSVWDSNFLAVYHLQAANGNGYFEDSTANGHTLDNTSGHSEVATAPINSGRLFNDNGTYDDALYTGYTTNQVPALDCDITLSCWCNRDDTSDHHTALGIGEQIGSNRRSIYIYPSVFSAECNNAARYSNTNISTTWVHVAATWPGAAASRVLSNVKCYRNGVDDSAADAYPNLTGTYNAFSSRNTNISVGHGGVLGLHYWRGRVDEARVSVVQRSANWIKGEYWSMKKTTWPGDGWLSWSAAVQATVFHNPLPTFMSSRA